MVGGCWLHVDKMEFGAIQHKFFYKAFPPLLKKSNNPEGVCHSKQIGKRVIKERICP